jgi:NAD(P)-dependent dehydrogenase (short-subunit alcohol dehydrogenase family)
LINSGQKAGENIKGRLCMVTGASSGIGKEIALGVAKLGADVIMVCRDKGRGLSAMDEIRRKSGNDSVELLIADLSSQVQIRKLAYEYTAKHDKLHVLVNNAGVTVNKRCLTVDALEMTFAVNYLAYFMLTNLLIDVLKSSSPARIVNMASMVYRTVSLDFDNLQGEKSYNKDINYSKSKLADIIFTYELARRLEGTGVTANCVCPGLVSTQLWERSNKLVDFFKTFIKGPEQGAKIPIYLASSPEIENMTGKYFQTRQHFKYFKINIKGAICETTAETYNREVAVKLWRVSESLTGISSSI